MDSVFDQARSEVFEKIHLSCNTTLVDYPAIASRARFRWMEDQNWERLIFQMKAWMLAGRVPDDSRYQRVEYPDGAWQMFKDRHLPEWLKNRFPVKMKVVEIETVRNTYFCCPHLVTDDRRTHVEFMMTARRRT